MYECTSRQWGSLVGYSVEWAPIEMKANMCLLYFPNRRHQWRWIVEYLNEPVTESARAISPPPSQFVRLSTVPFSFSSFLSFPITAKYKLPWWSIVCVYTDAYCRDLYASSTTTSAVISIAEKNSAWALANRAQVHSTWTCNLADNDPTRWLPAGCSRQMILPNNYCQYGLPFARRVIRCHLHFRIYKRIIILHSIGIEALDWLVFTWLVCVCQAKYNLNWV